MKTLERVCFLHLFKMREQILRVGDEEVWTASNTKIPGRDNTKISHMNIYFW